MKKIKFEIKSYVDRFIDAIKEFEKNDKSVKHLTPDKFFIRIEKISNLKFVKAKKLNDWYESGEISNADLFYTLSGLLALTIKVREECAFFDKVDNFIIEQIIEANTKRDIEEAKVAIKNTIELIISVSIMYGEIHCNLHIFQELMKNYNKKIKGKKHCDYLAALSNGFNDSKIKDPQAIKEITVKLSEKFKKIKTHDELIENLDKIKVYLYMDKVIRSANKGTITTCHLNAERIVEVFNNKEVEL